MFIKRFSLCICFVVIGICLGLHIPDEIINIADSSEFKEIEIPIVFPKVDNFNSFWEILFHIYLNNFTVGILLSIVGFLTAGTVTAVVLVSNGYYITLLILESYQSGISSSQIFHSIAFHGFFEVISLLWLGVIGLEGYSFYKKVIFKNKKIGESLFDYKQLLLANMLLLLAATIEALYGKFIDAY